MKHSKKTKSILALSSAVVLALPALTLTGCSNISQYCIPIVTPENPFKVTNIKDPYRMSGTDGYGIYSTPADPTQSFTASQYYISDEKSKLQVPESYIYTSEYDNNFYQKTNGIYGFTNYNTPTWKHYATGQVPAGITNDRYQFSRQDDNDYSWLNPEKSSNLSYTASNGSLSSYQNLNISSAIATVNNTTYDFVNAFVYMNNYLNRIISQPKLSDIESYLSYVFSGDKGVGFDYGTDDDSKSRFYEYCLDNANLISTAATKYKFGPYSVKWAFNNTGITTTNDVFKTNKESGLGEAGNPFVSVYMKNLKDGDYAWGDSKPTTIIPKDESAQYEFPTNVDFTGSYVAKDDKQEYTYNEPKDTSGNFCNPYIKYTYNTDKTIKDFSGIMNIPVLISPTTIQSAYYDPSSNNSSIQPADWLTRTSELSNVQKQVNQDGAWDAVKKNVNLPNLNATTLTYTQKAQRTEKTGSNLYKSWMNSEMEAAIAAHKVDPRVEQWITDGTIKFGDWVALANYGVLTINFLFEYRESEGGTVQKKYVKALLPYFAGFSAVFPAYMLLTNTDCYAEINPDAKDATEGKGIYYIKYSGSGIEKDFNKLISALNDTALPNVNKTYSTTRDMMKEDPYMMFAWVFGNLGTQDNYDYVNNRAKVDYSAILPKDAA